MRHDRRTVLAALGLALPFGLPGWTQSGASSVVSAELRFRSVEDSIREAFRSGGGATYGTLPCRRVAVGHSELLPAGLQGCHNARSFADFPAGHLRIVRVAYEPGSIIAGVRLYVCTLDVVSTGGSNCGQSRPLDFATLPPAPYVHIPELELGASAPSHEVASQRSSPPYS